MISITTNHHIPDFAYGYIEDVFFIGDLCQGSINLKEGISIVIVQLVEMLGSIPTRLICRDEEKTYSMVSFELGKNNIEPSFSALFREGDKADKATAIARFKEETKDYDIQKAVFRTEDRKLK